VTAIGALGKSESAPLHKPQLACGCDHAAEALGARCTATFGPCCRAVGLEWYVLVDPNARQLRNRLRSAPRRIAA
jgi:hypothetical protein